jgi:hypothetical protein
VVLHQITGTCRPCETNPGRRAQIDASREVDLRRSRSVQLEPTHVTVSQSPPRFGAPARTGGDMVVVF